MPSLPRQERFASRVPPLREERLDIGSLRPLSVFAPFQLPECAPCQESSGYGCGRSGTDTKARLGGRPAAGGGTPNPLGASPGRRECN